MSIIKKPMLAVDAEDISKLTYPVLASPKLDGIRCLIVGGKALSRKFKPIPNNFIREWLEARLPDGLDGELMVGTNFQECQSGVMRVSGEPDFKFMAFDLVEDLATFQKRYDNLTYWWNTNRAIIGQRVQVVPHMLCKNEDELAEYENWCVNNGYEGTMVRAVNGPYKNGRSTLREGYLLKIKRWTDSEAEILEVREQMTNTNEKQVDELGHSKRSSHKEGMVPAGTLGEFWVKDLKSGLEFAVGTGEGLTKELRQQLWDTRDTLVGTIITYKYISHGVKELPRFPIYKGFRHIDDLGE
jgi:DNA ligase-1